MAPRIKHPKKKKGATYARVRNPYGHRGGMVDKLQARVSGLRKRARVRKGTAEVRRAFAQSSLNPTEVVSIYALPADLCYDAVTSKLVSGHPNYNGMDAELVTMGDADPNGNVPVSVQTASKGLIKTKLCGPLSPPRPQADPKDTPDDGCCVDTDAMIIICADPTHGWHGAQVTNIEKINDNGLATLTLVDHAGASKNARLPLCQMPEDGECCYDVATGTLLCDDPNNPNHGKKVTPNGDAADGYIYVCGHLDPTSSALTCARVPLCPERPPVECCYDAVKNILVCENGASPHGLTPEIVKQGQDDNGKPFVIVRHPDLNNHNRTLVWLCPEAPPLDCCYDAATGTLRCPGNATWDGKQVTLEHMTDVMQDGKVHAVVSHPDLPPPGIAQFPLCDDGVPDECCYDGTTGKLICPTDPELNGKDAGVVHQFTGPDGQPWVSVSWPGGGARMPLCDEECPPVFCCVNIDTGAFVCPGEPTLNGQQADVADIVSDSYGYNQARLTDGTLVPICGKRCPPPELCPDCPTCPPGMWMTPDKECVPPPLDCPDCPPGQECPPGMWRDPNGVCRLPPDCPPDRRPPGRTPPGQEHPCFGPPQPVPSPPPRLPRPPVPVADCTDDCAAGPAQPVPSQLPPMFRSRHANPSHSTAWWDAEGHCCEECALGMPCARDCNCPDKAAKAANPHSWYHMNPCGGAYVEANPGHSSGTLHVPGTDGYKVALVKQAPDGRVLVKGMASSSGKPLRVGGQQGRHSECVGKCLSYGKWTEERCKELCDEDAGYRSAPGSAVPGSAVPVIPWAVGTQPGPRPPGPARPPSGGADPVPDPEKTCVMKYMQMGYDLKHAQKLCGVQPDPTPVPDPEKTCVMKYMQMGYDLKHAQKLCGVAPEDPGPLPPPTTPWYSTCQVIWQKMPLTYPNNPAPFNQYKASDPGQKLSEWLTNVIYWSFRPPNNPGYPIQINPNDPNQQGAVKLWLQINKCVLQHQPFDKL